MSQGSHRVFRSRGAMRIGAWPHRWISNRGCIKRKQRIVPQAQIIERSELHDEIMRVLAVIDRLAKGSFTLLEKQWIETLRHGRRFKAQHGAKRKLSVP